MTAGKARRAGKKSKLNRRKIILTISAVLLVVLLILFFKPVSHSLGNIFNPKAVGTVRVDRYKDLNSEHLHYAKANGIKPFKSGKAFRAGINELVSENKLVKVANGKYYIVNRLGHSHPYLTPKAKKLLDEIGRRFYRKLEEKGMGRYYFRVSSLLRTQESQKSLSRSNSNAAQNSAHLYGTTFDIAYKNVIRKPLPWIRRSVENGPVIKLLSETIGELKKEGRCVVVTEYKEKCFHITAR
jgi:hypothetical protein